MRLYKILSLPAWQACQGQDRVSLGRDDAHFIHLAEADQVERIAAKFFADQSELVIVELDPQKLPGRLVHEANPGGETLYYHLYDGFLPFQAVTGFRHTLGSGQPEAGSLAD
jgi:uncharacterized protein (DUF952 family)